MAIDVNEGTLEQVIERIVTDYEAIDPPFDEELLPERNAITSIEGTENRALFSTLTVGLDYQRSSKRLWMKARDLWQAERWIYTPAEVVARRGELIDVFEEEGMRFGQQDAEIWYQNATTLQSYYDGNPLRLFDQYEYDAPRILSAVRSNYEFTYLGGDKIGPLWLRFIHEDVHPLSNITEVWMPVDTQIQKVSIPLLGNEYTLDKIRTFWTDFCHDHGFDPVKVDQPLWIIGSHWTDWGREYLQQCMETAAHSPSNTATRSESINLPSRTDYESLSEWVDAVATTLNVDPDVVWEVGEQIAREQSQ